MKGSHSGGRLDDHSKKAALAQSLPTSCLPRHEFIPVCRSWASRHLCHPNTAHSRRYGLRGIVQNESQIVPEREQDKVCILKTAN